MDVLLEVIVTSVADAVEAEVGGADRLELVAALLLGGLTPPLELVREIVERVSIPVRVMVRESPSMTVANSGEVRRLRTAAAEISKLRISGLVTGFVKDGLLDIDTT